MAQPYADIGACLDSARSKGIPLIDAELLTAHALRLRREFIVAHPEFVPAKKKYAHIHRLFARRARGEPISQIVGYREFFGRRFILNKHVLSPRPETELLVELTLRAVQKMRAPFIVDVGTGSGCIAISLAAHLPAARIVATDISKRALSVAGKNARRHGVSRKIDFVQSNLLRNVPDAPVDFIVANLPYCDPRTKLERSVADFEPRRALFGGRLGVAVISRLLRHIAARTHKPSSILLEIGFGQQYRIAALVEKFFGGSAVAWENDLAGIPRICRIDTARPLCSKN